MGLPLFQDKRMSVRKKLTGLLPGRLQRENSKVDIECTLKDVSTHGLGITSHEQIKVGEILFLKTGEQDIELLVSWSQPGFGKRDLFRFGLVTVDQNINLEKLFLNAGCLK